MSLSVDSIRYAIDVIRRANCAPCGLRYAVLVESNSVHVQSKDFSIRGIFLILPFVFPGMVFFAAFLIYFPAFYVGSVLDHALPYSTHLMVPFDRGSIVTVFAALLCVTTILITYVLKKIVDLRRSALMVHLWHTGLLYLFVAALVYDLWSSFGQDPTGDLRVTMLIAFAAFVIATNFTSNYVLSARLK